MGFLTMRRAGYCPIANEPCQSMCETPCGSRKFTDAEVDKHLDAVLKAAGSALRHYTMQKSLDDMRAAIAACGKEGDKNAHVLKSERGTGYTYGGLRSSWDRLCERAGIEDLHIHDLRGRAGVDAMLDDEGEEDIKAAQKLLGHKSEGMTRHYVEGKYHKRVKPSR